MGLGLGEGGGKGGGVSGALGQVANCDIYVLSGESWGLGMHKYKYIRRFWDHACLKVMN